MKSAEGSVGPAWQAGPASGSGRDSGDDFYRLHVFFTVQVTRSRATRFAAVFGGGRDARAPLAAARLFPAHKRGSLAAMWGFVAGLVLSTVAFGLGPANLSAEEVEESVTGIPRIFEERNIFDPQRRARQAAPPPAAEPSKPEFFRLTGTLISPGRNLAFFSGSRPEYNRVVETEGQVGDLLVAGIEPNHVILRNGGEPVEVSVGEAYLIAEQRLAGPGDDLGEPPVVTTQGEATPASTSSASDGGANNEVLRRMMERRRQE